MSKTTVIIKRHEYYIMSSDPDELLWRFQDIDEYEFEKFVADLWALQGWETEVTAEGDDAGIDIVARKSAPVPQKQVIQVKRYSPDNSVGRPEIQQYSSLRYEDDVDAVVVITTGQFTEGAEEVARKHNVKTINGRQLCSQINTVDRKQLVESYISGSMKQADANLNPQSDVNVSAGSQLMNRFDEDLPADEIPETIPGVVKLRKKIIHDIWRTKTQFEKAEKAYNSQEFYTACERYIDVLDKRAEIYLEIKRYDTGLSQTNQETKQHLTTPDTLLTLLNQQTPELDKHYIEAFQIAERAKGLEELTNDISTRCANIKSIISTGDSRKAMGKKDRAHAKYIEARDRLEQISEAVEIYEDLRDMYDKKIVDTHQESSTDEYEKLKSDVESKLETLDDSN